jgi:hypothetical protein
MLFGKRFDDRITVRVDSGEQCNLPFRALQRFTTRLQQPHTFFVPG